MARKTPVLLQDQYIAEHIQCGGVKIRAARKLGIPWSTLMNWFRDDEDFRARVEQAESEWYDDIRACLMERAKEKSDQAAFFFLKARYPETYDDEVRRAKWHNETGTQSPDAAPVQVYLVRDDAPEEVEELAPVGAEEGPEH